MSVNKIVTDFCFHGPYMLLRKQTLNNIHNKLHNMIRTMEKTHCRVTGVEEGKNIELDRIGIAGLVEKVMFEQRLKGSESLLCGSLEYFLEYSLPRVFQVGRTSSA